MDNSVTDQLLTIFESQAELAGIGIVCAIVAVLFGAWRRDADIFVSFASLGVAGVGAAIGSRLYWIILHDAPLSNLFVLESGFSSFGAIFGGGAAVVLLWFGLFDDEMEFRKVLDVLVPAGLVALAWARLGCIVNGCDFGVRTQVPWGIRYPRGSEVFEFHSQMGWVGVGESLSQPVHPLPIYLFLACAAAVVVAGFLTSRPGLSAGWAIIVYAGFRLPAEFFRAPIAGSTVFGLSTTVLASVALLTAGIMWLGFLYSRPQHEPRELAPKEDGST